MEGVGRYGWFERVGLQGGVEPQNGCGYGGDMFGVYTPVFSESLMAERLDRCGCAAVARVKNPGLSSATEANGTELWTEWDRVRSHGGRPCVVSVRKQIYTSTTPFILSTNTKNLLVKILESENATPRATDTPPIAGSKITRRPSEFVETSSASRKRIWTRAAVTCEE